MVIVAAKGSTGEAAAEPAPAQNPYAANQGDEAGESVDTKA